MWVYINVGGGLFGRMPYVRSGGVSDEVLRNLTKDELNVCPVCWMPLIVGEEGGVEADMWCEVQVLFKNKPSEVTEHKLSSERNRCLNVFGMPYAPSNYDSAHFIHRSSQGKNLVPWNNFWKYVKGSELVDNRKFPMETDAREPGKKADFFSYVCLGRGLFASASDPLSSFFESFTRERQFNFTRSEMVLDHLFGVFACCKDCNSKMTINAYTKDLFDLVFPPELYHKKQGLFDAGVSDTTGSKRPRRDEFAAKFDTDNCVSYLMLSGLLSEDELGKDAMGAFDGQYSVSIKARRETWQFRVVFIWCQLQILFCQWKRSSLDIPFEHHVGFVYSGTADLYASYILYAMHCASTPSDSGQQNITFSSFHYFYSSLYPQFVRKRAQRASGGIPVPCNLSDLIFSRSKP